MVLFLDTQILIWLEENPFNISATISDKILSATEVYFSKASVWEMAIKIKTGKLIIKKDLSAFVDGLIIDYNFKLLDISLLHIYQTQQLELFHRDPFDRIIAAQALVENIPLVSSDEIFDSYNIKRLW